MSPAEHYELAEMLISKAEKSINEVEQSLLLQFAQVHATLASCAWEFWNSQAEQG